MIQYESKNKYKVTVDCGIINGKRKRKSKTIMGSLADAKKCESDLIKQINEVRALEESVTDEFLETINEEEKEKRLTFKELAEMFIEDYCKSNLKENTIYGYQTLLKVILPEIGDMYIDEIKPLFLQRFYNKLKEKSYSSNTIRHYYVLISGIFERAKKWQLLDKNPNSCIDKPKLEKKEASIYDYEQVHKLFEALKNESIECQAPIILCLDTGMRREELNGLKWKNVNFENNEIFIEEVRLAVGNKIVVTSPKTAKSKRKIIVSDFAMNYLKELKAHQGELANLLEDKWHDTGYVFVNDNGLPYYPDTISKMFKKVQKKYNLEKLTLHQLRHTSASLLIYNNEDIATISTRLGHSNPATTLNIYSHVLESANSKVANTMNSILENI